MDVFIHIPKSAGSTVRRLLSLEYMVKHVLYFEPGNQSWRRHVSGDEPLQEQIAQRRIRLITGHTPFGVHTTIKRECRYFSLMRDPVARAVSEYYYAYDYPQHRLRQQITSGRLSIDEFMTSSAHISGEGQSIMLAGNSVSREGLATAAIENVRHSIAVVGVTERFDESILLIAKALGWKPPLIVRTNVTKLDKDVSARRDQSFADARERYHDRFATDYTVYQAVNSLLTERIAMEGAPFQLAIEALREIERDIARRTADRMYDRYELDEDSVLPPAAQRFLGSDPYRRIEEYLGQSGSWRPRRANFVGHIDRLSGSVISGWACDLASAEPISVTVRRGRDTIARVAADGPRADVVASGFPHERVGFRVGLEERIHKASDYDVCFGDTSLSLHR